MMELDLDKRWLAVRNPSIRENDIGLALVLRGAILWSYAHVEQRLTEIAIRCSYVSEYEGLRENLPFTPAKRIAFLRQVLESPGPLHRYRTLMTAVLNRYESARAIRNQMAHADMAMAGGPPLRFLEIVVDGGEITQRNEPHYPGSLEKEARRAGQFSRACQRLFFKLNQAGVLPTFDEGRGDRTP